MLVFYLSVYLALLSYFTPSATMVLLCMQPRSQSGTYVPDAKWLFLFSSSVILADEV